MTELPFVLAGPVAVMSWAVAKEEVVREFREACKERAADPRRSLLVRKLNYLPTCEYCTSFWVSLLWMFVARTPAVWDDWRGFVLAHQLVWALAVGYMTVFQALRVKVREGNANVETTEVVRKKLGA